MGFEDDFDYNYNDEFETDIADPDNMYGTDQPRKLSRKELKEAKKKNAEKTADLPKHKKGLFGKRERLDDNDESLTDEHIFDPTRSTMISTPRDRSSRERENTPIRSRESEFSYLFDPIDDGETEDDVYPEKSIYSDSETARDLLAGLSYDGSQDKDPEDFDRYFDEHSKPPASLSAFRRKIQRDEQPPEPAIPPDDPEPPKTAHVRAVPKKTEPQDDEIDSYLPDLRPGSVFAPQPEPQPTPQPAIEQKNTPPLPPLPPLPETPIHERQQEDRNYKNRRGFNPYDNFDHSDQDEDDYYMNHDQDKTNQDYNPYAGMYPPYPMAPMGQMMPYPVVMPGSGQNQSNNAQIQTIPIPYPMPMPMPMPMYGQYPSYPYQQYPQQYPAYPQQDPYDRYRDERYGDHEERRDSGRRTRRFNGHRNGQYREESRRYYDDQREPHRDDRYDSRRSDRYESSGDSRFGSVRVRRADSGQRGSVPQPPYEPPYDMREPSPAQPVAPAQISPIDTSQPANEPEKAAFAPNHFANFDFNFHKQENAVHPTETQTENNPVSDSLSGNKPGSGSPVGNAPVGNAPVGNGLGDSSFANDGFDDSFANDGFDDSFANDGFDDSFTNDGFDDDLAADNPGEPSPDNGKDAGGDEDDFGLGFGNKSISSDNTATFDLSGDKSSGGRFKKKK